MYKVDEVKALKAQLASLTSALSKLSTEGQTQASPPSIVSLATMANQKEQCEFEMTNYVERGQYRRHQQQFPTYYHPNLRNHENLSYANNKNVLQAPTGFNGTSNEKTSSFKDLMLEFGKELRSKTSVLENSIQTILNIVQSQGKTIQSMKVQISQTAASLNTL